MWSPAGALAILVLGFLLVLAGNYLFLRLRHRVAGRRRLMANTMGSVFLLFGLAKLWNLPDFVATFVRYDLFASRARPYAYLYPFLEIALAAAYFVGVNSSGLHASTLVLMLLSMFSVGVSLQRKRNLRCGCLGSLVHLPLSYATLIENVVMASMALVLLAESGKADAG